MQIDYLDLDNSVRNNEGEILSQSRCIHCGGSQPTEKCFNQHRKDNSHKKPPLNPHNYNNKRTRINGRKPNT